jgi:glutathione S-transferase
MSVATRTIASRNYGSWSLRGWLLCRLAGLDVEVVSSPPGEESTRAELLLLSPSFLVPRLEHGEVVVWDTLAIGEYLHEACPDAGLLPSGAAPRARTAAPSAERCTRASRTCAPPCP